MLAFIAGFADTTGFVALFGLFTAHITGNIVIAAVHWTRTGRTNAHVLREEAVEQLRLRAPTFVAFVLGAAAAAGGFVTIGYWSFAIPVVVAAAATALSMAPGAITPS